MKKIVALSLWILLLTMASSLFAQKLANDEVDYCLYFGVKDNKGEKELIKTVRICGSPAEQKIGERVLVAQMDLQGKIQQDSKGRIILVEGTRLPDGTLKVGSRKILVEGTLMPNGTIKAKKITW